jgi:hypothetical protein
MPRLAPFLALAALALGLLACPPEPQHPNGGPTPSATPSAAPVAAWKMKSFARAAEGCNQAWTCDCSAFKAKAGCHVDASSDDSTRGVCVAESGPPTGCDRCMALPPPGVCACKEACP